MYLNLHSYNARVNHETLWTYSIKFIFAAKWAEVEQDEDVKSVLDFIKTYNKDKNVIYTCAIGKCEDNDKMYKDTVWMFAYDNIDDRETICQLMIQEFETYHDPCEIVSPTSCPFMNKGDLI